MADRPADRAHVPNCYIDTRRRPPDRLVGSDQTRVGGDLSVGRHCPDAETVLHVDLNAMQLVDTPQTHEN